MNSVTIEGKNYVKAADIARELGYTADYVGQLCRAGKVDAQLVGRSWYVSDESIRNHKQSRYRSTKAASVKGIEKNIQTIDTNSKVSYKTPVAVSASTPKVTSPYAEERFYTRATEKPKVRYDVDESDLIPSNNVFKSKTGRLPVSLAGTQSVKIKSGSSIYDFDPTQREELKFSGKLSVTEVEGLSVDEKESEKQVKLDPTPEVDGLTDITSKIRVRHIIKSKVKNKTDLPLKHNTPGVLGMKRGRIASRNPAGGTLQVNVPSENTHVSSAGTYFLIVSCVVSVIVSILVLGAELTVTVEGGTLVTSYNFEIHELRELLAAAYSAAR